MPLVERNSYCELPPEDIHELAVLVTWLLGCLEEMEAAYNLEWLHSTDPGFHWHLSILPRLTIWGGFELQTGVIVNPVPPEEAARFFRESRNKYL